MRFISQLFIAVGVQLFLLLLLFVYVTTHRAEVAQWLNPARSTVSESATAVAVDQSTEYRSYEDQITSVIAAANPAVVSVIATKDVPVYERVYEEFNPFGDWFGGFQIPSVREEGTEEREVGGGSGFVVSEEGLIVTNRHVVNDEEARYSVVFSDGQVLPVTVLAKDEILDIAILELAETYDGEITHLSLGDSDALALGQTVIAIGNALAEFENSVSVGVVSGLSRNIVAGDGMGMFEQLEQVIQTDAAINPGNSGGPLLDSDGEVIGVNVAASIGAENIGFSLPINVVKGVISSVEQYGEIRRPLLGVRYTMITERMVELNELPVNYGALVVGGSDPDVLAVIPGSPADMAGIEANNIILSVDGVSLESASLANQLRQKSVGETVTLEVWQDGEINTISVELSQTNN